MFDNYIYKEYIYNEYGNHMFEDVLNLQLTPIECFITPVTPYLICDHYISTEIDEYDPKFIQCSIQIKGNNLRTNTNYNCIKNMDIIQIQVDYFDYFMDNILPYINEHNINVIIITSQWYLPQINRSDQTDYLLNNKNIILWMSQNPIYTNNEKYMAFPYGIYQEKINEYIHFVKTNQTNQKTTKLLNQCATIHDHLPINHIRRIYDLFGKNSGNYIYGYTEFLTNIAKSEFVISTTGDREDCYRHYECIGLNTIPVSNITNELFNDIFGKDMLYSYGEEMVNTNTVTCDYYLPNRDILTIFYWLRAINEKVAALTCKK